MKYYLVLLLTWMIVTVNSCEFGNDAIQGLYDRAEVFRKTKAFDPTNREIPLKQYYYHETEGIKRLAMNIGDEYMSETYKNNAASEIETITGEYFPKYSQPKTKSQLFFQRDENGELIFKGWNGKQLGFTLRNINAELPMEEDFKNVFLDLRTMRRKMFDFQMGLSKDDIERVWKFTCTIDSNGNLLTMYMENGGGSITVPSNLVDGKESISGRVSCNNKDQKYNVVDGKVAVNGDPFIPDLKL